MGGGGLFTLPPAVILSCFSAASHLHTWYQLISWLLSVDYWRWGEQLRFFPAARCIKDASVLFLPFVLGLICVWKGVKECALAGSDMSSNFSLINSTSPQPEVVKRWNSLGAAGSSCYRTLYQVTFRTVKVDESSPIWEEISTLIIEVAVHFLSLSSHVTSSAPSLSFRWFNCRSFPLVPPVTNQIRGDHLFCQAEP